MLYHFKTRYLQRHDLILEILCNFVQTPSVRKAVTRVVGGWLLDLPDRYSYHHKLIPLLITSLSDEQADIKELADELWHDVGKGFKKLNLLH